MKRSWRICVVVALTACAWALNCVDAASEADALENLRLKSSDELVAILDIEHDQDPEAAIEAVSFHIYDVVVGELLRRRDIESIPLLLDRVNDDAQVLLKGNEMQPWLAWYDTPVRVKYKVRFILERMLTPAHYVAMCGDGLSSDVDLLAAKEFFAMHRNEIGESLISGKDSG